MPYQKLLMKTIAESNHTNKDIVEQLNEKGLHIDKSYLSKLVNGKLPAPREEVSRAIAQICNIDERKLVIEGYFDKAPKEIKNILCNLQKMTTLPVLPMIENKIDTETFKIIEEQLLQEPICDFLIELLDSSENTIIDIINNKISLSYDNMPNFTMKIEEPVYLSISNNDMYPIIPKDSKITIELSDKYQNGDIVALKYDNQTIARYYFMNNDIVSFNAIKKDAKPIDYKDKNVTILGKVKKVITEIQ